MKTTTIQIALFPKEIINRPDKIGNDVNNSLNGIFDGVPNILDLPSDIPTDIPIAQFKSSNGIYNLNVSRGRIDLIIIPNIFEDISPVEAHKEYNNIINTYCKSIIENLNIVRVGFITSVFNAIENNVETICNKYLAGGYKNDKKEITIRTNEPSAVKEFSINNIKIIEANTLFINKKNNEQKKKGIFEQFDTNNIVIPNKVITYQELLDIYNEALNKIANEITEVS